MKRILIYLVLLGTLISSQAWAWDSHDGIITGDTVSTSVPQEFNTDSGTDVPDQCDHHSCHGAAHIVGLIINHSAPFMARSHHEFFMLSRAPNILYISPLLRPPIV